MNFIRLFFIAAAMGLGGMASAIPTYISQVCRPHLEAEMFCLDSLSEESHQISLHIWEGTHGGEPLQQVLQPALDLLRPVVGYVLENPWVLLTFAIPALQAWLPLIGFQGSGIVAGSIAASIRSAIGNVPQGSLFAFLQSNGAGGFAQVAIQMAGAWVAIAVALAALGKALLDGGARDEKVAGLLEQVWAGVT